MPIHTRSRPRSTRAAGLYNSTCTGCHGANGAAGELGPGLAIPGRSYARNTDSAGLRRHPAWHCRHADARRSRSKLSDDQIWKITAYVNGLRGTADRLPPSPGDVAAGEAVFWGKGELRLLSYGQGPRQHRRPRPDQPGIFAQDQFHPRRPDQGTAPRLWSRRGAAASSHAAANVSGSAHYRAPEASQEVRGVLRNEDSFSLQVMGTGPNVAPVRPQPG